MITTLWEPGYGFNFGAYNMISGEAGDSLMKKKVLQLICLEM